MFKLFKSKSKNEPKEPPKPVITYTPPFLTSPPMLNKVTNSSSSNTPTEPTRSDLQREFNSIGGSLVIRKTSLSIIKEYYNEDAWDLDSPLLREKIEEIVELFTSINSKQVYSTNDEKYERLLSMTDHILNMKSKLENSVETIVRHLDTIINSKIIPLNIIESFKVINDEVKKSLLIPKEFESELKSISIGIRGEDAVNKHLKQYDYRLHNYSNVLFEFNQDGKQTTSETDNLVVCPNGVFAIEVKNLGTTGNYKLLIEKDGRWLKVYNDGKRVPIDNITTQAYRHVAYNERMINENLKDSSNFINVHPIIVIANEDVNIENHTDIVVVRASNIYNEIRKHKESIDRDTISKICRIIETNAKPPLKFPYKPYLEIATLHLHKQLELLSWLKFAVVNLDYLGAIPSIHSVPNPLKDTGSWYLIVSNHAKLCKNTDARRKLLYDIGYLERRKDYLNQKLNNKF